MKVGYFCGDGDMKAGGVAPYADRVLVALSGYSFKDVELTAIAPLDAPRHGSVRYRNIKRNGLIRKAMFHLSDCLYLLTHPRYGGRIAPYRGWLSKIHCDWRFDLLHFPFQVPYRTTFRSPFIVTMHDVQELHFPEFFAPDERRSRANLYTGAIEQAARIVVSFDHVKADLLRYFRLEEEKVVVIPVPYSACKFPEYSQIEGQQIEREYQFAMPFLLYPAQTWEHKNHLGLIGAFEEVCDRCGQDIHLVCTGVLNDFYTSTIEKRVSSSRYRDRIHFLGVVSGKNLHWLYRKALGVVIPSLYEAGSFPLIEAMQIGAPVVCARTTSLPGTIGDDRFVFDPRNRESMVDKVLSLVGDRAFREDNRLNSQKRAKWMQELELGSEYEKLWRSTLERTVRR